MEPMECRSYSKSVKDVVLTDEEEHREMQVVALSWHCDSEKQTKALHSKWNKQEKPTANATTKMGASMRNQYLPLVD